MKPLGGLNSKTDGIEQARTNGLQPRDYSIRAHNKSSQDNRFPDPPESTSYIAYTKQLQAL